MHTYAHLFFALKEKSLPVPVNKNGLSLYYGYTNFLYLWNTSVIKSKMRCDY